METSEQHTGTDLVNFELLSDRFRLIKQTSSGILTRRIKGTGFIHKFMVQKRVPVTV